ncbi:MAG: winged helix DNA-binding domain-containing protein [Thermoleophilia bacterium]
MSPAPTRLRERLAAQLLAGDRAPDALTATRRLLAVQAQDPRGARLALRARTVDLTASAVDRALTEERSLVVSWLNRGTLHLVERDDLPWLHALTTPQLETGNARRLAQEGVPPAAAERGVRAIASALAAEGPLTRDALRERVRASGVPVAGQALVHLLLRATIEGLVVRGPVDGREQRFALARDWLGPQPAVDRERALAELAGRYLAGHGPADERDLARWAGIPLRDARAGLAAIAPRLLERPDGLVDLAGRAPTPPLPGPRLLGAFEPLLLGWTSRADVVGAHGSLVTANGVFRPFALVAGQARATWRLAGGRVALAGLEPLSVRTTVALERDAADVVRFLAG